MKITSNNSKHQRIMAEFIGREVIYCASSLVYELAQKWESFPDYEEDLFGAYQGSPVTRYADDQYRRIVDLDERGIIAVSVYAIDTETGEDSNNPVWSCWGSWDDVPCGDCSGTGWNALGERDCLTCQGTGINEEGIRNLDGSDQFDPRDVDLLSAHMDFYVGSMLETDEDPEEEEDPEYEEVFEHWIVSDHLAGLLVEHGEKVLHDFFGFSSIWCRTTTGQAIYMDQVISDICSGFSGDHWVQEEALKVA